MFYVPKELPDDILEKFAEHTMMRVLSAFSMIIFTLVFMSFSNIKLTFVLVGGLIFFFIFLLVQGSIISKRLNKALKLEGDISSFTQESLDGHKTILAYNKTEDFYEVFGKKNKEYYDSITKVYKISALSDSVLNIVTSVTTILSLILSLSLYSAGEIQQGTVVLFLTYLITIFRGLNGISNMWTNMQNGVASSKRINQILKLEANINNPEKPYLPDDRNIKGEIEFKDVDFCYNGEKKVLEDVNLKVEAGKSVAIVGPTGAGKTTFVNLVARLYEVNEGSVMIDGVDIREWDLKKLRSQIGYLIQDTFLFEDTIFNNLKYSNPSITEDEAMKTFKDLGVIKMIKDLPNGLDTRLQVGGKNLSAGQRQIIALARVLLRDPKILVLDEATSNIDTKSEKIWQNFLWIILR